MIRLIRMTGLCLALFLPQISNAQQMYGLFMIVKGDVTFQNPNSPAEKAKVGAKVFEGAVIKSEKDSRAKIVMADRNVFNLSPDSKLTIQKYDATPGRKAVSVNLDEGKVRVNVEQKYDGTKEKFLLKTPTVVAGVRGTQFLGSYSSTNKTSQVTAFQGNVAMTSFNSAGQPLGTVRVGKGQTSSAGANQAPSAPQFVPKQELKNLEKSTTAAGNEQNSSGETKKIGAGSNQDTGADNAKDIKVATTDKTGNTNTMIVFISPELPKQPPAPPVAPVLPPNTKVTINVR